MEKKDIKVVLDRNYNLLESESQLYFIIPYNPLYPIHHGQT